MYGKVFSSVFHGSMFGAGIHVFAVWTYVISCKDADQMVELNPDYLAAVLGGPVDLIEKAIEFLSSPDPRSRSQKEEGRRILPGNRPMLWHVVNGEYYDRIRNSDDKRRLNTAPADPPRAEDSIVPRGYVYYIGDPTADRIKIGFSGNPWARLNELRVGVPDAQILAVEAGSRNDERARHEQFSELRIGGEWFKRLPVLEDHVARLASARRATAPDRSTTRVATSVATVATVVPSIDRDTARDTDKAVRKSPEKGKTPSSAPRKRVAGSDDPSPVFQEAWGAYPPCPRKTRAAAWLQWKARLKQGATEEAMLAGTKAFAAAREGEDPHFTMSPARFYGRERHYETDYSPVAHTPSGDELLRKASPEIRARIARIEGIVADDAAEEERGRQIDQKRSAR